MYVGLARPRPARGAWWHGRGRAPAAAADRIGILYHLRQWRSQWIHKTTVNSNTDRMQGEQLHAMSTAATPASVRNCCATAGGSTSSKSAVL